MRSENPFIQRVSERDLARLRAHQEPEGDRVTLGEKPSPVVARKVVEAAAPASKQVRETDQNRASGTLKTFGNASLDSGNRWNGMPQLHAEQRAEAGTVVDLGNRSGTVSLDLAIATNFKLRLTGNAAITPSVANWPRDAYPRSGGLKAGLDFGVMVLIDNTGGHNISINARHWAGGVPDFDRAGWYEVGLGVMWFPGESLIVRAYPYLTPEED